MSRTPTYKRCVLIMADGARADVMADLCRTGRLPAIGDHLAGQGSLRTGVTAFPSTTGPAYLPYLTGCYPGTCNLPGIRWFDKDHYAESWFSKRRFRSYVGPESFFMNHDLDRQCKTLFELIPRSASIFSAINRGVGLRGNKSAMSRIWYWYYSHLTDRWGIVDEAAEEKTLRSLKEDPEFLFVVFPGVDEFSHLSGPFHPRTIEAYQRVDRAVGKIVDRLKKEDKWEETILIIVSDHGLSGTGAHFPLNQFLEGSGTHTFYYPKVVSRRSFEAASMVSGNGMSHLYFKSGDGWKGRTCWETLVSRKDRLIERLLERPEIAVMAAQRGDRAIVVKSGRGEAVIGTADRIEGLGFRGIHYKIKGGDPFGYPALPEVMTDRESFALTSATDYPDAPAQLLQIFRSSRTGDLILSAENGCDLRQRYEVPEHKSSHGSLHWEHMNVPIVSNIPLPEGPMRSVDVFPMILKLLGRPIPQGIDGV